jgi:hypothetical protein
MFVKVKIVEGASEDMIGTLSISSYYMFIDEI